MSVFTTVSTQIDYYQALNALEKLVYNREAARFSEWDLERLTNLVRAVNEKLEQNTGIARSICVTKLYKEGYDMVVQETHFATPRTFMPGTCV